LKGGFLNFIGIVILIALLTDFFLHFWADSLNIYCLKRDVPEPFQGVYDNEQYQKSQDYLRYNTKFDWISSSFHLLLFIGFWFAGGFNLLDQWVKDFSRGPVITGIIYLSILIAVRMVLDIPFTVYQTFVIEERFGFNKTTWQTFVVDRLKGLVLSSLIGIPLLAAILSFFEYAGLNAWWYCWLVVTLFTLLLQFIAPTWIMPLFNKFIPLEDGELKSAIMSYAKKIKFPLDNVFMMDGSKRSAKSNAFFTGFGRHKRIVLFDTLMKQTTVSELVAILAHEMGHFKKKHILITTCIGIVHTGILFFLLSLFLSLPALFEAFFMQEASIYAGMLFFSMLYSPVEFFLGIAMQIFSRHNEYQADRFAVETTREPSSLVTALKKLSVHNLSNLTPHPAYVFLNYSHPPILKRIDEIMKVPVE
jgi:STE24 endopeptidase